MAETPSSDQIVRAALQLGRYARERGPALVGVDEVIDMLNATSEEEIIGADAVARSLSDFLEGIPDSDPIPAALAPSGSIKIHYLPEYAGLPEMILGEPNGSGLDLFCATPGGFYLNTAESKIATIGCGFELALPFPVSEAYIGPLPELLPVGIVALNRTLDFNYRGEVMVTLVNLSNTRQRIERGQRIARMTFGSTSTRPNLVSVTGLG